jgi:uncharacterized protein (TIGR02271 family)
MKQQEPNRVRLDEMRGAPVVDNTGEEIGKVEEIFYDHETRVPEWVGVGTGFFGTKRVLVPVQGAQVTDDGLVVAYAKEYVQDGPDIDSDEISHEQETELSSFYGLGGGRTANVEDQALTRSEEELEVGKRDVEAGRVRLRKWVETEPVALDVELRREVAHVTREPINEPVGDHEFSEDAIEVPLREEQPMVSKRTVAKERIGVEKGVETQRQTVEDEIRKERVEVDGDVESR